jgi:hypothetical protein
MQNDLSSKMLMVQNDLLNTVTNIMSDKSIKEKDMCIILQLVQSRIAYMALTRITYENYQQKEQIFDLQNKIDMQAEQETNNDDLANETVGFPPPTETETPQGE